MQPIKEPVVKNETFVDPLPDSSVGIPRRGLPEEAIEKYQITVNLDKSRDIAHLYPYFDQRGNHVANKVRKRSEKLFYWQSPNKETTNSIQLFGQQLFPSGGRAVTVVEGELDAPSAWLLLGSRFPVVSVSSAGSAVNDCKRNYEYLDSFDEIVLCFDNDEGKTRPDGSVTHPGQDAAKKVAELFKPGKVRILTLSEGKDASDYLQKGIDEKKFKDEWWKAPVFRADHLRIGHELRDEILSEQEYFAIPYPWPSLNKKTYGIRNSELVLLMADTGVGKTSVMQEIEHAALTHPDAVERHLGLGLLHLEETNRDTGIGLLSIENSKRYRLPDTPRTAEELAAAFDKVLNTDRLVIYDHFGSNNIDEIVKKVRYMAVMGCKYIFIDHLSIIVSDQAEDERKALDEISTKLKTLTMEQDITIFCVVHTNRAGLARGSAGPEQVANIFLSLHRDKKSKDLWRSNVLYIEIEKNRFAGGAGPGCYLFYDPTTGRLSELDEEAIRLYEEGGSVNDTHVPF